MTRNVTLKLDAAILRKARHLAIERDQSLSQWVKELVERQVAGREDFAAARGRAIRRLEAGLRLGGKPLTRAQAHER